MVGVLSDADVIVFEPCSSKPSVLPSVVSQIQAVWKHEITEGFSFGMEQPRLGHGKNSCATCTNFGQTTFLLIISIQKSAVMSRPNQNGP